MICKYCNVETALSGGAHSNHVAWCHSNPKRAERAKALVKAREAIKGKPGSNQYIKAAREGRKIEVSQETRDKIGAAGTEVLAPFREKLAQEVQRALQFFFTATHFTRVDHIVLTGGSAVLEGLATLVADRTQVRTTIANPFANMALAPRIKPRQLLSDAPSLMVACGLAMRRADPE